VSSIPFQAFPVNENPASSACDFLLVEKLVDLISERLHVKRLFPKLCRLQGFRTAKAIKKRLRFCAAWRNLLNLNHRVFQPSMITLLL
jgi:hypothetical protein